jgi:hypothetical protein
MIHAAVRAHIAVKPITTDTVAREDELFLARLLAPRTAASAAVARPMAPAAVAHVTILEAVRLIHIH